MAPDPNEKKTEKKAEKSYLSSAVDSLNPWAGSRTSTPVPKEPPQPNAQTSSNADHSKNHLYGQSFKKYPADCPTLNVQWFHAIDVPKRKPALPKRRGAKEDAKPPPQPKKFSAFSASDSKSLEAAYQKILEEIEQERGGRVPITRNFSSGSRHSRALSTERANYTNEEKGEEQKPPGVKVPVNEDYLFDVDIEDRELAPVYWMGPIYEVRRGTWFYQEGSNLRPCEENLAAQLEEGYLKVKPWLYPPRSRSNSAGKDVTPKASVENLKAAATAQRDVGVKSTQKDPSSKMPPSAPQQLATHRLFGTYMNSIATYQDSTTAWLSSDTMLSWVTSTMYERFGSGGYMSGIKLIRGYSEPGKAKTEKRPATPPGPIEALKQDERQQKLIKRRSASPMRKGPPSDGGKDNDEPTEAEARESHIQKQISSFVESAENTDPDQREEVIRQREEKEIQEDYTAQAGETQDREIEHLVLVTHGIGQLLGLRMDSVNFVHDVNVLRKNLKTVYSSSADLRALNSESGGGPGNCRIQVLPICWRHLLDFPRRRTKKKEQDLADGSGEEEEYPSLDDITVEGVAFARSLISDLALDVLLYQSAYREQISEIVLRESNRIYKLFKERNPDFKGKVHIMGHSLGSAIMFDILCRQKETSRSTEGLKNPLRLWPSTERQEGKEHKDQKELSFEFDVDDLYFLGSPVGLFQMLKGRTISARHLPNAAPSESPLNPEYMEDPFLSSNTNEHVSAITGLPSSVSSPKVSQLFNIFHPSDPISYRVEPLISAAMSSLKPQALPYTKKGFLGVVAPQGLAGISVKVGQSFSGLWSSVSAGIASNLLNRSLGLTNEDVATITASAANQHNASPGAGSNISAGGVIPEHGGTGASASSLSHRANERKKQLADSQQSASQESLSGNEATLIDDDLETLYSQFQKKHTTIVKEDPDNAGTDWLEEERKMLKIRREEAKMRALNRNGRVDYCIQEGALDFNPMNTIASHMSYWADEDVSHFVMSQLLSNRRKAQQ